MLVLTRKMEEKIQIGPDVTVTVLRVKGRSVQIGIEAPGSVCILRGELVAAAELRTDIDETLSGPSTATSPKKKAKPTPTDPTAEEADPEESRPAPRRCRAPHGSHPSGAGGSLNPLCLGS